ncbi:septum site-determining protein MinC [Albibacillus kandeliae]|uniref:septum site-determining protein MinC n=1 Tax=Albibacillus kandeliae TaxID=2174228 RepID=UPI000D69F008|nr:septum site-determining protein MinC [Albibacillus kandeliae]
MPSNDTKDRGARAAADIRPFQIRGRFFTAVSLRPESEQQDESFFEALDDQLRQTPQFFANAPLILDLEQVPGLNGTEVLRRMVETLKQRNLAPFGVQNASGEQVRAASDLGLINITTGQDAPLKAERRQKAIKAVRQTPAKTKTITLPVRSGQTVIADEGDLIVIGPVSSGAELIAAGNIHVYGPLRGRAMAGAHGDETARVFCTRLEAELLAIAGLYRTSESLAPEYGLQNVQAFLKNERLCVETLG